MDFDQQDRLYPAQAAKYQKARADFVLFGTELKLLARAHELNTDDLKKRASEEAWDSLRLEHLKTSSVTSQSKRVQMLSGVDGNDPLSKHAALADFLVELCNDLGVALSNSQTNENDIRRIRAQIESMKLLSEAAEAAMHLARDVRGIPKGQSSVPRAVETTQVTYEVVFPEEIATAS